MQKLSSNESNLNVKYKIIKILVNLGENLQDIELSEEFLIVTKKEKNNNLVFIKIKNFALGKTLLRGCKDKL